MTLFEQLLLYIFPKTRFKSIEKHIEIVDKIEDGRAVRLLLYDGVRESGMFLDKYGDRDPLFYYMRTLKIAFDHYKGLDNMLLIGGGGFVLPKIYLNGHPERKVTVVELDPGYVELAKRFFFLDTNDKRIKIVISDGESYIAEQAHKLAPFEKFSLIVYDAYIGENPDTGILSERSMREAKKLLTPDGIYAFNMINEARDAISMETRLAQANLKRIFNYTKIVPCPNGGNCILFASDRKL